MVRKDVGYFREQKKAGQKITMLTAYDFMMAAILDSCDIDMLLVGDSLANVILGYKTTLPVTMDEMLHHTRAVARGTKTAMVIGDMPFMSYQVSKKEAMKNAGRFLKEGGAQGVKLEGGEEIAEKIARLVEAGIPVVAHLGLTPQSVHQIGLKVQGASEKGAAKLLSDAKAVQEAGAFALVLECIPRALAKDITDSLDIPTIGIGAGVDCDGQVLVIHDLLGLYTDRVPKFVKQYAHLKPTIVDAVASFRDEVLKGSWPDDSYSYGSGEQKQQ